MDEDLDFIRIRINVDTPNFGTTTPWLPVLIAHRVCWMLLLQRFSKVWHMSWHSRPTQVWPSPWTPHPQLPSGRKRPERLPSLATGSLVSRQSLNCLVTSRMLFVRYFSCQAMFTSHQTTVMPRSVITATLSGPLSISLALLKLSPRSGSRPLYCQVGGGNVARDCTEWQCSFSWLKL